jgi:lycopene cyclase domain-containing protein
MTYFGFLLRFLLIPILVFLALIYRDNQRNKQIHGFRNGRPIWLGIAIHILLAVAYTTPWDNYLVATNVWGYNSALVSGSMIGYVPIEEYTFFVLETILAGLWWWFLARRIPLPKQDLRSNKTYVYGSTSGLIFFWLIFTDLFFFGDPKWTYLAITLFWALPPVILQLLFGADILWHFRKLLFWAIVVPGTYLSLLDIVALQETTWAISPSQTTGIMLFGILPLEEIVFFFITNILIAFGMTLLLADVSQARFTEIKKSILVWQEKRSVNPQAR